MNKDMYSVLLLRDDRQVRRFSLSPFWFKLFLYALLLLLALAGGGFYAGYSFWRSNVQLVKERAGMERRVRDLQVELERLQNVEKILQSNDADEMQALYGAMSIQKKQQPAQAADAAAQFKSVDLGQVTVDKLALKQEGNGQIRFSCDIANVDQNTALSGQVELSLLSSKGRTAVEGNRADLGFQIQRFKKIVTTLSLPEGASVSDYQNLLITIKDSSGATLLSKLFPINDILS